MSKMPNVVVVPAWCQQTRRLFGVRMEEKSPSHWEGTWAFAMKDKAAAREGYDKTELRGSFELGAAYPGCPHCKSDSLFKCDCGKVTCWDGQTERVTCGWCSAIMNLEGTVDSLSAGTDR